MWLGSTLCAFAIDPAAGHMIEALPERDYGHEIYLQRCASCHGADRMQILQAPLTPQALKQYQTGTLMATIRLHCQKHPASGIRSMATWQQLKVARYLQREVNQRPPRQP